MSKKFKGKTCVYCTTPRSSATGDHVVAREFFPTPRPDGLPVVPACTRCNNEKSRLEHYATTVLPFGATHDRAAAALSEMVPARLAKNHRLAKLLAENAHTRFISNDGGASWDTESALPFDGEKVERLLGMIARGLIYWEWDVLLPDTDCVLHASFLTKPGRELLDRYFSGSGARTGVRNLGEGIFAYEGVQSAESPQLTLLRMSLCGAVLSGNAKEGDERVSVAYALSAPRRMPAATKFVELLQGGRASTP